MRHIFKKQPLKSALARNQTWVYWSRGPFTMTSRNLEKKKKTHCYMGMGPWHVFFLKHERELCIILLIGEE
jgi:hypothetical protein